MLNNVSMAVKGFDALAHISALAYNKSELGLSDSEYKLLEELCEKAIHNLEAGFLKLMEEK